MQKKLFLTKTVSFICKHLALKETQIKKKFVLKKVIYSARDSLALIQMRLLKDTYGGERTVTKNVNVSLIKKLKTEEESGAVQRDAERE